VRRAGLWAVLGGAALALAGCWGVGSIQQRGLVTALAVDAAEGGGYRVTLALANPLGRPTPQGGTPSGSSIYLRTAEGPTVPQAMLRLEAASHLQLDFTHIQVVVVSEALARAGLGAPLEFLARAPEVITTSWLVVARGEGGADVLQGQRQVRPQVGEVLDQVLRWARQGTPTYASRLYSFLQHVQIPGDDPTTAGVAAGTAPTPDAVPVQASGVALFQGDRLVGWLDGPAALGWLLATGRAQKQYFTVPTADGPAVLRVVQCRRQIRVRHGPSGPELGLDVRVTARLVGAPPSGGAADAARSAGQAPGLTDAAAAVLREDVRQAVGSAQAAGSDAFGFGEYVRVWDPLDWSALGGRWDATAFPRAPVAVEVQVRLSSFGLAVCPLLGGC
jgi:spore germination protein KC